MMGQLVKEKWVAQVRKMSNWVEFSYKLNKND